MKGDFQRGFAALPLVSALALVFTLSLLMLLRSGMLDRDQVAKAQLRADYHQREEALMRALIAVFPQKVVDCMKGNYAASDAYSWAKVFADAQSIASTSASLSADVLVRFGLENARNANPGNTAGTSQEISIASLSGVAGNVTPGTTQYAAVFSNAKFAGKVPPLLDMSVSLQDADALRPVVSLGKKYATQNSELLADVGKYPVYNFIPYPNIRFGYAVAGQPVVAKHNWWAFGVTFGNTALAPSKPVQTITKYYVLSLYEIPSQLPIEAATFAQLGTHQDGTAWDASQITISGGVYADQMAVSDTFGSSRITGKQSVALAKSMSIGGTLVGNDFDQAGVREQMQVRSNSEALPVALSSNSGRLAFLPIQRGNQFLQRAADVASTNVWEAYSKGAEQCPITVAATAMVSLADQTPTSIRVRYVLPNGSFSQIVLKRGLNWPTLLQTGGDVIPFQTELTDASHPGLTFYPTLLNAWLTSLGAASITVNCGIQFRTDASADPLTVRPPSSSPLLDDMAVIIRKGQDLTKYTAGLSIVTPHRVYLGDNLNSTAAAAPPVGSGLSASSVYYPPLSIFAGELRVGTTATVRPFELHGQVSTLATGASSSWKPMDWKSGSSDAIHVGVTAELKPLESPANLPPVHQMNWLIVIEEIPQ